MTRVVKIKDIVTNVSELCGNCETNDSNNWVKSESGDIFCTECVFNKYNVKYEQYVDYILKSRKESLVIAEEYNSPKELSDQCFRNSASLLYILQSEARIPKDNIHLCVGDVYKKETGEIRHYWVCLKSQGSIIHLDPEIFYDSGIWIHNNLPSNYKLKNTIPLSKSSRFPSKVKNWNNRF